MESIKEIYKIGNGPSSSHTMGPGLAAENFRANNPDAKSFKVTLCGSLAATGRGHLTDYAILQKLKPFEAEVIWKPEFIHPKHTNCLKFEAFDAENKLLNSTEYFSVGGGKILKGNEQDISQQIYEHKNMAEILQYLKVTGLTLWEYVIEREPDDLTRYLKEVWKVMQESIANGLKNAGVLPGGLKLQRKAPLYFAKSKMLSKVEAKTSLIFAYALAVSEENAACGKVVTAPTCGSCGVVPSVLYSLKKSYKLHDDKIIRALITAGLIGNLVKRNASISGAEVGCQGEVGTACSMASAAAAHLLGGSPHQIEYAAEIGLEHHLGLTCDPIKGLVQIPCIERNVHAAMRAFNAANYSILSDGRHFVSFDQTVQAMKQTGKDLPSLYKETSTGGLAIFADK